MRIRVWLLGPILHTFSHSISAAVTMHFSIIIVRTRLSLRIGEVGQVMHTVTTFLVTITAIEEERFAASFASTVECLSSWSFPDAGVVLATCLTCIRCDSTGRASRAFSVDMLTCEASAGSHIAGQSENELGADSWNVFEVSIFLSWKIDSLV